ncbi:corepressor interacting with RBPJ 1 [Salvia divinorum]|uniref:Corepressor interacting with RBPJ 1 n=1 Tax=Salvia divinorum TaxID=28513 RepID=A0ABD1FP39_SALDI
MGNSVGSVFSGVGQVVGNIFGHPLDFLSGKACNSVCAPTWDFICYIENFCVAQLLKFVMVAILAYFVLLFFYLLFSLGICQCICRTLFHIIWGFFSSYFSALHCCCSYFCLKLQSVKRNRRRMRRQRRDVEAPNSSGSSSSSSSSSSSGGGGEEGGEMSRFGPRRNVECKISELSKRRRYKEEHLRRSLRANSHRAGVEFSGNSRHLSRMKNVDDHIRVTRNSKFARKGSRHGARPRGGRPSLMLEGRVTE